MPDYAQGNYGPTRSTYGTSGPNWCRDVLEAETHSILIDGSAMLAAFPSGVIPSGVGIVKVTSTGQGAPAGTASSTPAGYLLNELRVASGQKYYQAVVHAGTVTERLLPAPTNGGTAGAAPTGFKAALTAVAHI